MSADPPTLFVHCATSLIGEFRDMVGPDALTGDQRAALIGAEGAAPLRALIRAVLTYKARRRATP